MSLPTSRAQAKAEGSIHYLTGKPCKNGHVAFRFTCDGRCSDCLIQWRRDNPESVAAARRKYYKENTDKVAQWSSEYNREWQKENRDKCNKNWNAFRAAHPEKIKESDKAYYKANREKILTRAKLYREKKRAERLEGGSK